MDLAIALGQGLGLAVAARASPPAPLAIGASAASLGVADGALSFADDPLTVAVLWIAAAVELAADAIWPGAEAGARLVRRVIGGGLAFELVAGNEVPYVGLLIGAAVAAAVGISLRQIRTRAIKGGGDARGTALVEDSDGVATGVVGTWFGPVSYVFAARSRLAVRPHAPPRAGEVQGPAGAALVRPRTGVG